MQRLVNLRNSFKEWVYKSQITIINALVTVILIGIVIFVMLNRATALQRQVSEENLINMAGITANEVQTNYLTYYNILRTTSQIMQNYRNVDIGQRRIFLNQIMLELLNQNNTFINVYSIWKPNELDGLDATYADTPGSDRSGQFISGYTREGGFIEQKAFPEFRYAIDFDYYQLGLSDGVVSEPIPITNENLNTWVIDIQIPIFVNNNTVGIIGVTVNLNILQNLVHSLNLYENGRTMICTNKATLVAHNNVELRGTSFMAAGIYRDDLEPLLATSVRGSMFRQIQLSMDELMPNAFTFQDSLIVSYPLRSLDPDTGIYYRPEAGFPNWAVVTTIPMSNVLASINNLLRFSIFFTIGAGVFAAFVLFITSSSITRRAGTLQQSLERATAMQDNLKYGLFLMDRKYVIQDAYSKALDKILSVSELQGKVFLEILSSSLKTKELDGLSDYFDMIFNASIDKELLEGINPINVFSYTSNETKEVKSLRTTFTLTEGKKKLEYLLGTVEDITAEKELEKQLIEAQMGREKEMQFLFQVIQLNPRVLSDFIEDTEYEFDKVNDLLKNKTHFHREVLVEIYQSIHAVKSNALILNLETFSNKLHVLESSIRNLQEKYEDFVPFDDFLGLVLELDESLKEKDQLKEAVSKIQNFKSMSGEEKDQERFILIETLTQICNKTQAALNKKVKLVVESIDEAVLDHGPRRVIKEVLTQLIRNAVYHGIEMPDERESLGKNPEGEIRVSMRYKDNQIIIKLTDNGMGINFDKIRNTAETFNLFSNPEEANDTNYLLQLLFSPGFSTLDQADLHAGRGMGLNL
ncbi:MAG: hypothetical protein FWH35_05735, partial [Treponema sp.]|nr:hypothetical protein [Treponema sp.]